MMTKRNILDFRTGYGFTQEDMARILGVTTKTIQRAEKSGMIDSKHAHKMSLIENYLNHGLEALRVVKKANPVKAKVLLWGNSFDLINKRDFLVPHIKNSKTSLSAGQIFIYENVRNIIVQIVSTHSKNIDELRLAMILFLLDRKELMTNGIGVTGLTYIKRSDYASPKNISEILDDMVSSKLLCSTYNKETKQIEYIVHDSTYQLEINKEIQNNTLELCKKSTDELINMMDNSGILLREINKEIEMD